MRLPLRQRRRREGRITLGYQHMQQRMVGVMGLNDHRARLLGAPGPPGDLEDQLRHPLAGAESRCRTSPGQHRRCPPRSRRESGGPWPASGCRSAVRRPAVVNIRQQGFQTAAPAGAVAIHAGDARLLGNSRRSAVSRRSVPWPSARRSTLPHSGQAASTGPTVAAMVADQPALAQMQGHAGVAMPALAEPAAFVAEQNRGKPRRLRNSNTCSSRAR
jgi:hypothetical protein